MAIHLIVTVIANDVCRWSFIHHHFADGSLPVRFFTSLCCPIVHKALHTKSTIINYTVFISTRSKFISFAHCALEGGGSKRQSYEFFSHFAFAFIRLCQSVFGWDCFVNLFFSLFSKYSFVETKEHFVEHRSRLTSLPPPPSDASEWRLWYSLVFACAFNGNARRTLTSKS